MPDAAKEWKEWSQLTPSQQKAWKVGCLVALFLPMAFCYSAMFDDGSPVRRGIDRELCEATWQLCTTSPSECGVVEERRLRECQRQGF